jgi:hypothetical protein
MDFVTAKRISKLVQHKEELETFIDKVKAFDNIKKIECSLLLENNERKELHTVKLSSEIVLPIIESQLESIKRAIENV